MKYWKICLQNKNIRHEYQGITDYAFVIKHNEDNAFIVQLKITQSQH